MIVARIKAPHFVAGFTLVDWTVWDVAPIIKYMHGWDIHRVYDYCTKKGWVCECLSSGEHM